MDNLKTCTNCGKQFRVLEKEEKFLSDKNLPLPTLCPSCRQVRRLKLRGSRDLFKTKCQKCNKDIIVSYDPQTVKNTILCKQDYERYFEENDPIIKDPLPQI